MIQKCPRRYKEERGGNDLILFGLPWGTAIDSTNTKKHRTVIIKGGKTIYLRDKKRNPGLPAESQRRREKAEKLLV